MIDVADLLLRFQKAGVRLWSEEDRLKFSAPAGGLSPEQRLELKEHKADILAFLRKSTQKSSIIKKADRNSTLYLSSSQMRMWLFQQLFPKSPIYNISIALHLKGELNYQALELALNTIIGRHESLRTTFTSENDVPSQVVHKFNPQNSDSPLHITHVPDAPLDILREESARCFDLESGPLARYILYRLNVKDHIFQITMHHIIADGWSLAIFQTELFQLYRSIINIGIIQLPELVLQYPDYAQWQLAKKSSPEALASLNFFRHHFANSNQILDLPSDRPRAREFDFRGRCQLITLPSDTLTRVQALCNLTTTTPYMFFLSTLSVLLYRYCEQPDILVGTPMANRESSEFENVFGVFINTLVFRTRLAPDLTFCQVMDQIKEQTIQCVAHQSYPFELLLDELQVDRDVSRNPLFQVMFNYQQSLNLSSFDDLLNVETIDFDRGFCHVDLTLAIEHRNDHFFAFFEYSLQLFDPDRMTRMAGHFYEIVNAALGNHDLPISHFQLFNVSELRSLLEHQSISNAAPPTVSLPQLFLSTALKFPEKDAVIYSGSPENIAYTYAHLSRSSGALSRHLQTHGIGPGDMVGVYFTRSVEMVVALLAVLRSGATYIPLDPLFPKDRLAFMAQDANLKAILTQCALECDFLPHETEVFFLENFMSISQDDEAGFNCEVDLESLAYVIYTSGSTGRPKGVQVTHANLVNFLTSMALEPGFTSADRLLAVTTLSFDIAGLELYLPLIQGGTVVVASKEQTMDGQEIARLITAYHISVMQATPITWRLLLDAEWPDTELKVLCGGEALPLDLAERLHAHATSLWNVYGPTETTIWSSLHEIQSTEQGPIPIGKAVANTQLYACDQNLMLRPIGIPGELLIGGVGLATGYLNRPGLTARQFIPNPFSGKPGMRLYRTGDLARLRSDGFFECMGRIDHQVKLRGYRIELGEIEAALTGIPLIMAAVVLCRELSPGNSQLVGYLIPTEGYELDLDRISDQLAKDLPPYMVPSAYLVMDEFPKTPNNKVDRNAFPLPSAVPQKALVLPRTSLEKELAEIWSDVLALQSISVLDNFFKLGGHSLSASRVVSRIRAHMKLDIPLMLIFRNPTIAELACALPIELSADSSKLVPVSRKGELPLSFFQERLWFIQALQPDSTAYHISMALALEGDIDIECFKKALTDIVARHESLRTTLVQTATVSQVIHTEFELNLTLCDCQNSEQRDALLLQHTHVLFDLSCGPLYHFYLIRCNANPDSITFQLVLHHIISDGWSLGILVDELATIYQALIRKTTPLLAPLTLQFADYAAWQRQYFTSSQTEIALSFWKAQLDGAPYTLELPTDRTRPPQFLFEGASVPVRLDGPLVHKLRALALEQGTTLYMLLLGAFGLLLRRYTGVTDLLIGSPIATRTNPEVEHIIGCFVNTLVLRIDLSGNPSLGSYLSGVRERSLQVFEHRDFPFEQLVDALQPERELSRNPLFQVMFNLHSQKLPQFHTEHLQGKPLVFDRKRSHVDLTLVLEDHEDDIYGSIEFCTALFDRARIENMARHLCQLLDHMTHAPGSNIDQLEILSPEERTRLLGLNQPLCNMPTELLHERFFRLAQEKPDLIAINHLETSLSYGALATAATLLAQVLKMKGVGAEHVVAICIDREPQLLVAMFAVLQAGGAFVSLDPAYPKDRLAFILEDTRAQLILSQSKLAEVLPATGCEIILRDGPVPTLSEPLHFPTPSARQNNLAYFIYTSGSTGKPKGVAIPHSCASIMIQWARDTFDDEDLSQVLFSTSTNFDLSIFEIFVPLSWGGSIFVVRNALDLVDHALPVTLLNTVPSVMSELIKVKAVPSCVRTVNLAGEALSLKLVQSIYAETQTGRVFNLYGPSEDTTYSTFALVTREATWVPIGAPITNTQAFILDAHLNLLPHGIPGELYLGGEGLARGYLYRPSLTAERFLPNPYSDQPGSRIYRTGDLVRFRCGSIDYLGRLDHQVKLRGFRIELGEIEARLNCYPGIAASLVVVGEEKGTSHLVAYLVPSPNMTLASEKLEAYLRGQLPDFMIPSRFLVLEAFPLTPNKKIDRKALPKPDFTTLPSSAAKKSINPWEEVIAQIWAEVLCSDSPGVNDNFFKLGGHSLLAVRVLSKIRQTLEINISLVDFFGNPTISGLASLLSHSTPSDQQDMIAELGNEDTRQLSYAQKGLWFIDKLQPDSAAYTIFVGYHLRGPLSHPHLKSSLSFLVSRHEALRACFPAIDGAPIVTIRPPFEPSLEFVNLDDDAQLAELARREAGRPFDLSQGPLFRFTLFQIAESHHLLLMSTHHIISDGWSQSLFLQEFIRVYHQLIQSNQPILPALSNSFFDYANWQRKRLTGNHLDSLLTFWKTNLSGASFQLDLPLDKPRPAIQRFRGANYPLSLTPEQSDILSQLARSSGVTNFMLLTAVFGLLLSRYSGQKDMLLGSPIAGRNHSALEGIFGFFVNSLVLRLNFEGELNFTQLLERVRAQSLAAWTHSELPFDLLVEHIQPERDLSRNPLFQVMFSLQETNSSQGYALEVVPEYFDTGVAHFDLTLALESHNGIYSGVLEYNTDLFETSSIAQMVQHLSNLLTSALESPGLAISGLNMLSPEERNLLVSTWNQTLAPSAPTMFHDQVARIALLTPDAPALIIGQQCLTFHELLEQADELSQTLLQQGIRPECVVGICLPRSISMFVSVLAILKAGGAYLSLDPDYPKERLKFMIDDSAPAAILISAQTQASLPECDTSRIRVDALPTAPKARLSARHDSAQLAYVIYTSGTTGKPKGVMISQASLSNLMITQQMAFPLTREDRVLVFSSLNFDASIFLLTWGWQYGAPVYTAPRDMLLGKGLEEFIILHGITTILLPPSVLPSLDPKKMPLLQHLIVGGEAVTREQAQTWARNRQLVNAYGPTEVTVWGTWTPLNGSGSTPIGNPVANARCYVTDAQLRLQPIGTPGELLIAGAGLARGYLMRPQLTAQAFIPNPFAREDGLSQFGQRLYRTGDLVRWNPSGKLEYLGRIDYQVKIRGFRVEPGEITTRLLEHGDIRDALVIPREDKPGELRLVAYMLPMGSNVPTAKALREFLRERLPEYMIPGAFVALESFPLTADGSKVDRRALPIPGLIRTATEISSSRPSTAVESAIIDTWKDLLQVDQVAIDDNFFDLGGHSLLLTQVQSRLSAHFKRQLAITELFQYPTVSGLAEFLSPGHVEKGLKVHINQRNSGNYEDIAIIGMAGRFPMADDVDTFWSNLEKGRHCITYFSTEELQSAGINQALLQNPDYVPAMGYLADIECFDAAFFGYSPREARLLDPQQRQFLQGCWHALEHAGYNPHAYPGRIALFAGTSSSTYMTENLLANPALIESASMMTITLGNDKDFLPTRVAYKLNLKGPGINVQTACSTSLVAIHLACMSLLQGECEMALAGGVRLILPRKTGYIYQEGGITSPDGHCRAFDIEARGVLGGSGYGVVVLKRLTEAKLEGDSIHALIKGTAINNDGSDKIGFTAPSIEGQAGVIAQAQAVGSIHPDTIGYIEAHGTGTELGDPIEIAALSKAFRLKTDRKAFCAIGSVKTNIGHLDAGAGVVGLIKAALVLKHKCIPASLHFNQPNPNIDFANSPFYVNARLSEFPQGETPRRAAVSSFGLGGTNAHAILEEAPPSCETDPGKSVMLIPLSGANDTALEQAIENLRAYLASPHSAALADVAYTLQVGRAPLRKRAMLVATDSADALALLLQKEKINFATQNPGDPRLVFMFPGQGAQYVNMARQIYEQEPSFQEDVDNCCELLQPYLGLNLRDLLFPEPELGSADLTRISEDLNQTEMTQPALFTICYSLARTCIGWGLRPDAMIGHSIGEFVAATLAGVFSLEDALMLVAARGRLMQGQPPGVMLAVPLPEDDLLPLLVGRQVSLAAINAPMRCVVSGPADEIESLSDFLSERDLACRVLHTSHAFHSQMMDGILEPFVELMHRVEMKTPKGRFLSNVSGTWITAEQATDPEYWALHLRGTVRFADGLAVLLQEKSTRFFLEVGPGKTLTTFLQQQLDRQSLHGRAQTLRHPNDQVGDMRFLTETLGQLWLAGITIDWQGLHSGQRRRRVPLPTYPFQKDRFWVEPGPTETLHSGPLKKCFNIDDWFYLPSWKRQPHMVTPIPSPATRSHWLIFEDAMGLGQALTRALEDQGNRVTRLRVGRHFEATGGSSFAIDPSRKEDFEALYTELSRRGDLPTKMIHLWNLTQPELAHLSRSQFADICADRGFFTLMHLAQVLEKLQIEDKIHLAIVTNGMQEIHDGDLKYPEKATLLGAVKVLPREFPDLTIRSIDIELPSIGVLEATVQQLILEVEAHSPDTIVALRGRHRWIQTFDQVPVKASQPSRLRKGGTYLITGGLSGVGLMLAAHLSRNFKARLVLTRRSPFPRRDDWDQWLNVNGSENPISQVIGSLRDMEKAGAAVLAISGDVADRTQMAQIVAEAHNRFGKIDGVIHAAGVLPSGMFSDMTAPIARKTFQAKVNGTLTLSELLAGEGLDFLMLFSSTSAILGNMGYGDYVAANCFLDAFAQQQSAQQHGYTVSVNWDGWQEVGMAVGRASDQTLSNAINNNEGCEVVDRILSAPPHNGVIVSTMNLNRMIEEIRQFMVAQANGDLADELEKVHADEAILERPDTLDFAAPSNDTEKRVAAHWCEALGFGKVGRHDDFFELGGDSLLGTMLATKHRKIFKVKFGARLISELPTVAQQAAYIDNQLAEAIKEIRPEYAPPQSETQTLVVTLTQDLLNVAKIGIKDSFTALGGNLAKAVTLANRITEKLSISLSAEMILEQPVIEELSESIDTLLWASGAMPESQSSSDITEFEL